MLPLFPKAGNVFLKDWQTDVVENFTEAPKENLRVLSTLYIYSSASLILFHFISLLSLCLTSISLPLWLGYSCPEMELVLRQHQRMSTYHTRLWRSKTSEISGTEKYSYSVKFCHLSGMIMTLGNTVVVNETWLFYSFTVNHVYDKTIIYHMQFTTIPAYRIEPKTLTELTLKSSNNIFMVGHSLRLHRPIYTQRPAKILYKASLQR